VKKSKGEWGMTETALAVAGIIVILITVVELIMDGD